MSKILENEVRGAISIEQASSIEQYALNHNWSVHKYRQISIYCNTDHISSIGTVSTGKARIIIDIRDDALKIKVKLGNALDFSRNEYTINCSVDSVEAVAVLFKLLGIENGFARKFDRTDYVTANGVQLTVKQNCNMGDHFELERNSESHDAVETFESIIKEFNLLLWTKDELSAAIQRDHDSVEARNILSSLKEMII